MHVEVRSVHLDLFLEVMSDSNIRIPQNYLYPKMSDFNISFYHDDDEFVCLFVF